MFSFAASRKLFAGSVLSVVAALTALPGCAAEPEEDSAEGEDAVTASSLDAFQPERCTGRSMTKAEAEQWAEETNASPRARSRDRLRPDSSKMVNLEPFWKRTRTCEADGTRCTAWSQPKKEIVDFESYALDTRTGEDIDLVHIKGNAALSCLNSVKCGAFGGKGECVAPLAPPGVQYLVGSAMCSRGQAPSFRYKVKVTNTCARVAAEEIAIVDSKRIETQRAAYGQVRDY